MAGKKVYLLDTLFYIYFWGKEYALHPNYLFYFAICEISKQKAVALIRRKLEGNVAARQRKVLRTWAWLGR